MPIRGKLRNMLVSPPPLKSVARALLLLAAGVALASCSSPGETTRNVVRNMNPMNWFDDEPTEKAQKPLEAKAGTKEDEAYPALGSVPERPKRPTPEEQAKRISEGLAADTENARYTDQQLRQSTAVFGGRPQPPGASQIPMPSETRSAAAPAASEEDGRVVPPPPVPTPEAQSAAARSVEPPAVRPPQQPVAEPSATPPPIVRPPAPASAETASAPPPVRPPAVSPPSAAPAPVQPPAAKAPEVRAPQPVETPRRVEPPKPVAPPSATAANGPSAASGDVARQFATPSGTPSESPRPAPAPEPLGGPSGERVTAVKPPAPAQMARSEAGPAPERQLKSLQVGTIYFEDGSAQLSSRDMSVLEAVTQVARQTGGRIRVIGHSSMGARAADPERREAVNFQMSLKRANAVAGELVRQGVPADRVEVIPQGDNEPAYAETTPTGAAYNRRTEIFIDYLDNS